MEERGPLGPPFHKPSLSGTQTWLPQPLLSAGRPPFHPSLLSFLCSGFSSAQAFGLCVQLLPKGASLLPTTRTLAHLLHVHSCHSLRGSFQPTSKEKGQLVRSPDQAPRGGVPAELAGSRNPWNNQELRVARSKTEKTNFASLPACVSRSLIMPKCLVNRKDLLT